MATAAILNAAALAAAVDALLGTGAGQALLAELNNARSAHSFSRSSPHKGSLWITSCDGKWASWSGMVASLYFHPTAEHSVTTVGKLGEKRSVAKAGQWAVSIQTRALMGNKAMYNTAE